MSKTAVALCAAIAVVGIFVGGSIRQIAALQREVDTLRGLATATALDLDTHRSIHRAVQEDYDRIVSERIATLEQALVLLDGECPRTDDAMLRAMLELEGSDG